MEQLQIVPFKKSLFWSRNAEEALLAALNACARVTGQVSDIELPNSVAFGAWFKQIQGQRAGGESVLAAECLSHLNLSGAIPQTNDCYRAIFSYSDLAGANLKGDNFLDANLKGDNLLDADLEKVALLGANLKVANIVMANLEMDNLEKNSLMRANLKMANLIGANFSGAILDGTNLAGDKIPARDRVVPSQKVGG
jgi:uncharacterized protein YjbI with pentapeptide repeats